jgi:hypothetical protein
VIILKYEAIIQQLENIKTNQLENKEDYQAIEAINELTETLDILQTS